MIQPKLPHMGVCSTPLFVKLFWNQRQGGLMVIELDSGVCSPGSSPGRGHGVVFLGKTLDTHSASLHPGV